MNIKFPNGVYLAGIDDLPNNSVGQEQLERIKNAKIEAGYSIIETNKESYSHFIRLNIDSDKLWDFLIVCIDQIFHENIAFILGFKDCENEELYKSKYMSKQALVNILNEYSFELCNDGYINFGITFQSNNQVEEVFINDVKCLNIWTNKIEKYNIIFQKFELHQKNDLAFIDEYPRVTVANYPGMKFRYERIIEEIKLKCEN